MTTLYIHAPNVHQGGGEKLLLLLLRTLSGIERAFCVLDSRLIIPKEYVCKIKHKKVKHTLTSRLLAEFWLKKNVKIGDKVLCFGNLPPIFKLPGNVFVFLQNRYLIDDIDLGKFPAKVRLRILLERLWLRVRARNAGEFIVQTPSMRTRLQSVLGKHVNIKVMPYFETNVKYNRSSSGKRNPSLKTVYDFLYVASGEPHKNHKRLVEAWSLLASEDQYPSLCITLSEKDFPELWSWIRQKIEEQGLNISNLGVLPLERITDLYSQVGALIYPSYLESLGLPLIEASRAGLPILAPELDYVRDLVDPEQTFDPMSSSSIARAVKRHMGVQEKSLDIVNPSEFLRTLG